MVCLLAHKIDQMRQLCEELFRIIKERPDIINIPMFQIQVEEEILNCVSKLFSGEESKSFHPIKKSVIHIWDSIEGVIDERNDSSIKIRELFQTAKISERTLLRLFHERFGISPKAYLTRLRLCKVRRELRQAVPCEVKIADTANNWGFWHMGQFASDYKRFFGELPSTTLERV